MLIITRNLAAIAEVSAARIAKTKADYRARVNEAISDVRRHYITDIVGQDMLYLVKRDEAIAYVADPDPQIENYPLIEWEVGVTATTAYQVAQTWLYMNSALKPIAGHLENIRLTAINAINDAGDEAEIVAAFGTCTTAIATFLVEAEG